MGIVGSIYSYFMGTGEDVCDPETGLTTRQKRILTESWSLIGNRKSQKKYGIALFMHLFQTDPALQDYFPSFKDKSLEELQTMPAMRAHATTLMYQIGSFIDNLDDSELLVGLFQKIAKNHFKRGIGLKEFQELRTIFGTFLEKELGSSATPELKEAWDRLFSKLCSVIKTFEDDDLA